MELLTFYVPAAELINSSGKKHFRLELIELKRLGIIEDFYDVVAVKVSKDQVIHFQSVMEFDGASAIPQQPLKKQRNED